MSNKEIKTREEIFKRLSEQKSREAIFNNDIRALYEAVDSSIHFMDESIAITALKRTIEDAKREGSIYAVQNTERVYQEQFKREAESC